MQNSVNFLVDNSSCFSTKNLYVTNIRCLKTYTEKLLQEANFIIIQIDNGNIENSRENRNYATWRLQRVEKYINQLSEKKLRQMLNSLWSHLYRLEHAQGDAHPLIKKLRESILM